jgi:hypothetical protein
MERWHQVCLFIKSLGRADRVGKQLCRKQNSGQRVCALVLDIKVIRGNTLTRVQYKLRDNDSSKNRIY